MRRKKILLLLLTRKYIDDKYKEDGDGNKDESSVFNIRPLVTSKVK